MTLDEYFGDWMKVIDRAELSNVMAKVGHEYRRKPLCPAQSDVFRARELQLAYFLVTGRRLMRITYLLH